MARVTVDEAVFSSIENGLQQTLSSFLAGEANRAVRRGAYQNTNRFLSDKIKVAMEIAIRMTDRKYPLAKERDEARRPIPGAPHLVDSWSYTLARAEEGVSLINSRPNARMLLQGFDTPSVFTPQPGRPLVFPRAGLPQHKVPEKGGWRKVGKSITRPVPASQQAVSPGEMIPAMAIRRAFQTGRRV